MLVNCVSHELMQANTLGILVNAPFRFYQTGSRYFGTPNAESDWDFFTAMYDDKGNCFGIETFLRNIGFIKCGKEQAEKYNDNITVAVFAKDNVHVQIVSNINRKIAMQNILKASGLLSTRIDKSVAKMLWTVAYWATTDIV